MVLIGTLAILGSLAGQFGAARLALPQQRHWARWLALLALLGGLFCLIGARGWYDALLSSAAIAAAANGWRLWRQRYHALWRQRATAQTVQYLSIFILLTAIIRWLDHSGDTYPMRSLIMVSILLAGGTVLLTTMFNVVMRRARRYGPLPEKRLPTITLAIPARNETHALTQAIEAALTADYPKLEILVYDDCSQDNTPQIIRQYAHKGVRFVSGREPEKGWLGKNYAYRVLAEEASGEYILFSGADIHFEHDALRQLVAEMLTQHLDMLSVLPTRQILDWQTALVQPLRYFWQLAIPSFVRGAPPVLSSCWMVRRARLLEIGGFGGVINAITPERFLARGFDKSRKYRFLIAGQKLGISTRKLLSSQLATTVRTSYPSLHRSLFHTYALCLGILAVLVTPYAMVLYDLLGGSVSGAWWLAAFLVGAAHALIITTTYPGAALLAPLVLPASALAELIYIAWSFYQYEFGTVTWKGRNICLPVMNVLPRNIKRTH